MFTLFDRRTVVRLGTKDNVIDGCLFIERTFSKEYNRMNEFYIFLNFTETFSMLMT